VIEATTTVHCEACGTQLLDKEKPCPRCYTRICADEYRELVEALLPYARLYVGPEDAPDADKEARMQARLIARATKALAAIRVKWDEDAERWVRA